MLTSIGIYAGIGSGLIGAKWAGFTPIFNHEPRSFFDERTFKHYFPNAGFSQDLITRSESPNLTISNPSCNSFSIAGNTDKDSIDREFIKDQDVYKAFVLIEKYLPNYFILENVYGLLDHVEVLKTGLRFKAVPEEIFLTGYKIKAVKLNALHFGVPQTRRRVYFVGVRGTDHPPIQITKHRGEGKHYVGFSVFEGFRGLTAETPNMELPRHSFEREIGIKRLKADETYYGSQGNKKLNLRKPSPVVGTASSRSLHPFEPRALTVRESARLMGYPDDFVFYGSVIDQLSQVGKAVVPQVIFSICLDIRIHAKKYGTI